MCRNYFVVMMVGVISSCMYFPALRDDFSMMRDDVFTKTIKEVRKADGTHLLIDKYSGWHIGSEYFRGATVSQLEGYFLAAGGVCHMDELDSATLLCKLNRAWRYRNIGAYSDPASWCVPSMALTYRFYLLERLEVNSTWSELEFDAVNTGDCPGRGK